MKECPNCHEMLGNNVTECFKCRYDFVRKKVISREVIEQTRLAKEEALRRKDEENRAKRERVEGYKKTITPADVKLTTGYNFEGYKILGYNGIISGEVVLGTSFLSELSASVRDILGSGSKLFSDKIIQAKRQAQQELSMRAIETVSNAVIGVDFDIMLLNNNNIDCSICKRNRRLHRKIKEEPGGLPGSSFIFLSSKPYSRRHRHKEHGAFHTQSRQYR